MPRHTERERLYDSPHWRRLSALFLKRNRWCVHCLARGKLERSRHVDHKLGHRDADWRERFFEWTNLQALCVSCHWVKTHAVDLAPRVAHDAPSVRPFGAPWPVTCRGGGGG